MQIEEIYSYFDKYRKENRSLFTTSSFQTHSLVLLHIISKYDYDIPIYFMNTGFHFPETLSFKDQIAREFNIKVIDLKPATPKNLQFDSQGNFLFTSSPTNCCNINKVLPTEELLKSHDVWINGVRADQNSHRKSFQIEVPSKYNTLRFHPMLDWTSKDIWKYRKEHNLPEHPLEAKGFLSIGCEPCTQKYIGGDARKGRWFGMTKTECGLNTDLIEKK